MTRPPITVQLGDLQGNVLRGYGHPLTAYVFVRVDEPAAGRRWIGEAVPRVTTGAPWTGSKPATTLNIAFTYVGLRALEVAPRVLDAFPPEFREGMAGRTDTLGDTGLTAPEHWEAPLGSGESHVLAMIDAASTEVLEQALDDLHAEIEGAGDLAIVGEQRTEVLPSGREHFGFSDGFSQPAVEGSGVEPRPGQGVPEAHGRWRPVRPGEFVLGYEDEDGVLPDAPPGALGRNATYMVYRKLYQAVALFRRFVRERARLLGGDPDLVAAKIVGRWDDGTPLVLSPYARDESIAGDRSRINDFRYKSDRYGYRCPLGAHIRRTHPRDALGWEARRSFRHRLIRRGMPYGPPLAPDAEDEDGQDRGLVFVCFNASIARQFETVQTQWVNDGNIFGLGEDKDLLVSAEEGTGKMTVQGLPPAFLAPQKAFVSTRGGEYLFLPGLAGLRAVADAATDRP